MYEQLARDLAQLDSLLTLARDEAQRFITGIDGQTPASLVPRIDSEPIPERGLGAELAFKQFLERYGSGITAGSGARYWGFVTGGTTPAALLGDWLVSAYDLNAADKGGASTANVEVEAISMLRGLFGLPPEFAGVFVSGASMSNFVGLASGREWVAAQYGKSIAQDGIGAIPPFRVLSAAPHSSAIKSLSMLGIGRAAMLPIPRLPGNREAIDPEALRAELAGLNGQPCIVIASAGTVNTVDFDDLRTLGELKQEFPFWLHVDGAFGGFAACSPRYRHLMGGIELADSVTIDAHKWLNVPYDSAMIFTRHSRYQLDVFQNSAAYLPELGDDPDFFHYTPENSRRWRALPTWFTLMAYGREGYQEIVERCCDLSLELGRRIEESADFRLLAPVRMNVVCFTLRDDPTPERLRGFLDRLRDGGRLFLTPTRYGGVPGMRAALVNWRTEPADLDIGWEALRMAL